VDNPIVILNQEASKEFLMSKTPHDMYRFFLKATQLELMNAEYLQAEESQRIAMSELQSKREVLPILESEVKKWEQKYNACASLDGLREKVDRLKEEMAWAFVCEKEKMLEGLAKELKAEEARMPKFVQKVEESRKKLDTKESERDRVEDELKAAGDEATELEPQLMDRKSGLTAEKLSTKAAVDALRRTQSELRGVVVDRSQVMTRIDEIRTSSHVDYDAMRHEREQKIAQLEDKVTKQTAHSRTLEFSVTQFRQAVSAQQETVSELRVEERELRRRHDAADKKLRELQSSRSNNLSRFAPWMPELFRRVEDAHRRGRFHAKPRGPVGAHLRLQDPRWALAVEKCLGPGLLTTFCVTDYHDEKVFEEIAKSVCRPQPMPSTLTSKFCAQVHNVPRNPNRFPSVLEVISTCSYGLDRAFSTFLLEWNPLKYLVCSQNLNQ